MENKKKHNKGHKPYEFDRTKFLEEFVQYKLTEEAESDFRAHAKVGAKADLDIIEKNLSVLIHTSHSKTELPKNKFRYQFSGLVVLTDEDEKEITVVYWVNKKLKVSKTMNRDLKNKFAVIGLDPTGFAYLKEETMEEEPTPIQQEVIEEPVLDSSKASEVVEKVEGAVK